MVATAERPIVEMETSAPRIVDRARARWAGMAGRMGMACAIAGFGVIALAWNGAAGLDYAQGQLPYLLSGGFGGLGLIIIGGALIVAESNRRDRAILERKLEQIALGLGRGAAGNGSAGSATGNMVAVGRSSFHRPDCRLVEGRGDHELLSRADAEAQGLARCRICNP